MPPLPRRKTILCLALAGALAAAFPASLRAGPVLKIPTSLPEGDPRAGLLGEWTRELSRLTPWDASLEFLGPGAVAGARTALAEPDGLTLGFLSYDEAVTRPLQDLAPYEASELAPAVLFPSGAPILLYRGDGPQAPPPRLRPVPGTHARLLSPSLRPVPGPTLLALDALRGLGAAVSLREPPRERGGGPAPAPDHAARERLWAACYLALEPGEFLALPYEGYAFLADAGLSPRAAMLLGDAGWGPGAAGGASPWPRLPNLPDAPSFSDLGLRHRVREAFGFYYPAETSERLQEGVPLLVAWLASYSGASPSGLPFFVSGETAGGDVARGLFEGEVEARLELLRAFSLAGGGS
ncbi:MAG: hypothetical protein LBG06_02800 [Deltaproteobacteria bacterium]|jgi:hypothetical protein|nr:hypothetical protein [Deltaproteobacteria bacterium]